MPPDRPRVLFVTRKWPPAIGGMETYSAELSRALGTVVSLEVRPLPGRPDGRPPSLLALLTFYLSTALVLLRRRRDFDLVHVGDFVLFPLVCWDALVAPDRRRVVSVHGLDLVYGRRAGWRPLLYRLFLALARHSATAAHAYIANSRHTASLAVEAGFGPCTAVPLGVRLEGYDPGEPRIEHRERFLFFFGRAVPRKGLRWFAEEVLPRLPADVRLLAAGSVWDRDALPENDPEGRFTHLGVISDEEITNYCRRAAAVIVPNLPSAGEGDVEGFGLVNLEAAARGAIVLAANVEGVPDAVAEGRTGFLLPPVDAAAWASKIKEILEWDERKRADFSADARRALQEHFSWARVAHDTAEIYKQVLEAPTEPSRQPHARLDVPSRRGKAAKICSIVEREQSLQGARVLEIGTGSGVIASELAHAAGSGSVAAVDVVDQRVQREGYDFKLVDSADLPFADASFDIVISNHVIEHVGDRAAQLQHLSESRRVLRPGGIAYLATPNRWALIEPHFKLPLLSWLPPGLRSSYVRLARRGPRYDCSPLSRGELRDALASAGFAYRERSLDAIRVMAEVERSRAARLVVRWVPSWLQRAAQPGLPTLIFILEPDEPVVDTAGWRAA